MRKISFLISLSFMLMLVNAKAGFCYHDFDWKSLNLTPSQAQKIKQLDGNWENINKKTLPHLKKDQIKLKKALKSPNISENSIRDLYISIMMQQQRLRYNAIEIFLAKRRLLNEKQLCELNKELHLQNIKK